MIAMSLMSAFYVANSGMTTSQNALNTVSHNLTNVNTKGYSRQQILQGTAGYNTISKNANMVADRQIGLGVVYAATRQVRNVFLDANYRRESGRSAFYETSYEAISEVESLLGELEGATFSKALDNLWVAAEELYKDPSGSVTQNLLVQRAAQFVESASSVYDGLCNYQDNLNLKVKEKVEKINYYANQIYELNDAIVRIESGELEHANDLRDTRNLALDELGKLGNISYSEDVFGNVTVKFEGNILVNESYVDEIGLDVDNTTGFYTCYWTREAEYDRDIQTGERELVSTEGALVFNMDQVIQTATNTDIGELKAIILARGDHRATYADIDGKYEKDISQSIIMNVQAEYDQLIHNVVTAVNEVIYQAANTGTGYLCGEDGNPYMLFEMIGCDDYLTDAQIDDLVYECNQKKINISAADIKNTANGGKVWIEDAWNLIKEKAAASGVEPPQRLRDTQYSAFNIQINQELMQSPTKLGFIQDDDSVDFDTARALLDCFEYDGYSLNITLQTTGDFSKYYSNLISQVANSGNVFEGVKENQEQTVSAIENAREQLVGVSSDEELSNMIRYQNAYNANSRFFNVVNEMLAHLLNSMT